MSAAETVSDDGRVGRRELIRRLLFERDREGLTLAELSQRCGIPTGTLAGWVARLRREHEAEAAETLGRPSGGFVELVARTESDQQRDGRIEIVLKGGRRVLVGPTFDEHVLTRLVRTLEAC